MTGTAPKPKRHPTIPSSRGARAYKALVADLKAQWRRAGKVCARCGQRIDYAAPMLDPSACVAGHIRSWRDYPHLRMDPANFQPEHRVCGQSAGPDADARPGIGMTSEDW